MQYQLKANARKVQAKKDDILTVSHLLCHFNIACILSVAIHFTRAYIHMYKRMYVCVERKYFYHHAAIMVN